MDLQCRCNHFDNDTLKCNEKWNLKQIHIHNIWLHFILNLAFLLYLSGGLHGSLTLPAVGVSSGMRIPVVIHLVWQHGIQHPGVLNTDTHTEWTECEHQYEVGCCWICHLATSVLLYIWIGSQRLWLPAASSYRWQDPPTQLNTAGYNLTTSRAMINSNSVYWFGNQYWFAAAKKLSFNLLWFLRLPWSQCEPKWQAEKDQISDLKATQTKKQKQFQIALH